VVPIIFVYVNVTEGFVTERLQCLVVICLCSVVIIREMTECQRVCLTLFNFVSFSDCKSMQLAGYKH